MSEPIALPSPEEPARACTRCEIVKPASAFHRAGPGRRRKVCAACRPSTRDRSTEESAHAKRIRKLRNDYKITLEQYEHMLAVQEGKCAICHGGPGVEGKLHIDHCHKSGVVRALLCGPCNRALGVYESVAERAAPYLVRYGKGNPLLKAAAQRP
ncbi:endonuclease VII domain-containing protein [Streptomyces griseoincarnatus]